MPVKLGTAHVTEDNYRIPVSRRKCAPKSFRNVEISQKKGIKALVCCPAGEYEKGRCKVGVQLRTIIYDKDKWSKSEAERHSKKFRRK